MPSESTRRMVEQAQAELQRLLEEVATARVDTFEQLVGACVACLAAGGKLLVFGNGGSAAQAQHLAAEFVNRLGHEREALAAIALTSDAAVLTSVANDRGYEEVFSRQIEALARDADLVLALSTSGASPNLVAALLTARRLGVNSAAMLGGDGGAAVEVCDLALVVPSRSPARVQEVHLFLSHVLCQRIEQRLTDSTS